MEQAVTEVSLCARLGESTERSPVEPKACWEDEASSPLRRRQVGFRATLFHENPRCWRSAGVERGLAVQPKDKLG